MSTERTPATHALAAAALPTVPTVGWLTTKYGNDDPVREIGTYKVVGDEVRRTGRLIGLEWEFEAYVSTVIAWEPVEVSPR